MARDSFVGRSTELNRLQQKLEQVKQGGPGQLLSVRGRRQAGKSRLVTEFLERSGVPGFFFTAPGIHDKYTDLERFALAAADSSLPHADVFTETQPTSWYGALRQLSAALPEGPCVVVFDEFPWLCRNDPVLEGTLQAQWDHVFERRSVLMILIGSDLSTMERLTSYDRPLFGRAQEMIIEPLNLAEVASMLGAEPANAIDSYLVTGGYPRTLLQWQRGVSTWDFVTSQLTNPTSALVTAGGRIMAAEFPAELEAAHILRTIGSGERSFSNILRASHASRAALDRALTALNVDKRLVGRDVPTSTKPSNEVRYRVADTYLRFWLRFVLPAIPDIERGRADLPLARLRRSWPDYRGRAVEPIVREALTRIAYDDERLGGAGYVGGWWPRNNNPEVDLVGVDRVQPRPSRVSFVGSIKWGDRREFTDRDFQQLVLDRAAVPGAEEAPLVAVTRNGQASPSGLAASYSAADIVGAWSHQIGL